MLVSVLGFGRIWSVRPASHQRPPAFFNTTGVVVSGKLRYRSCPYGYVRVDACSGFEPEKADRVLGRVFLSDGIIGWNGVRKLFLRTPLPRHAEPTSYLLRLRSEETGVIDRRSVWLCDGGEVLSFSESGRAQESLALLPRYGWIRAGDSTWLVVPDADRPCIAFLQRAERRLETA